MRGVCNPRSQECLHFCLLAGDWREDGAVSSEAGSDDGQSEAGQVRINTLRDLSDVTRSLVLSPVSQTQIIKFITHQLTLMAQKCITE